MADTSMSGSWRSVTDLTAVIRGPDKPLAAASPNHVRGGLGAERKGRPMAADVVGRAIAEATVGMGRHAAA